MGINSSLSINRWSEIFKYFNQVERLEVDDSAGKLDIFIKGRKDPLQAIRDNLDDSLGKFKGNPSEVVVSFLKEHGVLVVYQDTLVGLFDIQAYSGFVEKTDIKESVLKITELLLSIKSVSKTDILGVKFDHWIFSDSIILVIDTNRSPLFSGSVEFFLGTCSMILQESMELGFPLRGAIGGGNFYKDGEVMVSSALVDADIYEKEQDWFGAVLTPKAIKIIEKANEFIKKSDKDRATIDLSANKFKSFVEYGDIPWKNKSNDHNVERPDKTFYIKPFTGSYKDWTSTLPSYFDKNKAKNKISNSNRLYS